MKWARTGGKPVAKANQVVNPGDVIYVEAAKTDGQFVLHQIPEVSGAMVVEDPWTGRVLAMVGGFSFDQSQFNRATQALRNPVHRSSPSFTLRRWTTVTRLRQSSSTLRSKLIKDLAPVPGDRKTTRASSTVQRRCVSASNIHAT
jgi:hypothetical protein